MGDEGGSRLSVEEITDTSWVTRDSGERVEFDSGMRRDTTEGKTNFLLVYPGPMLKRWADLLTRGSEKYEQDRQPGELRNWQKANGLAEHERFLESFARHATQYMVNALRRIQGEDPIPDGYDDAGNPIYEDHAAACFFNINGAEYSYERLVAEQVASDEESYDELIEAYSRTARTCAWRLTSICCGDPSDCTC